MAALNKTDNQFAQSSNHTLERLTLTYSTGNANARTVPSKKVEVLSDKTLVKMQWSKLKHYVMFPNYIDHADLNEKDSELLGKLIRAQLEQGDMLELKG